MELSLAPGWAAGPQTGQGRFGCAWRADFPRLGTRATLWPIAGLRPWLARQAGILLERRSDQERPALAAALEAAPALDTAFPVRQFLMRAAAECLGRALEGGRPVDAVARFHLGNGARVERIHRAGDRSAKGLKQAHGRRVHHLCNLKGLDRCRRHVAQGKVPVPSRVQALYI
jgi:malonyl-CoA decarboxylase